MTSPSLLEHHFISKDLSPHKMKILALVVLALGSASAKSSGPYLPSGWRPQGPAFFLPAEVKTSLAIPLKGDPVEETVASGSDFLREYGPPKISLNLIQQGLPNEGIEQPFVNQANFTRKDAEVSNDDEKEDQRSAIEEITTTTDTIVEEITTFKETESFARGKSINIEIQADLEEGSQTTVLGTTEDNIEVTENKEADKDNVNINIISTVKDRVGITDNEVNNVGGVRNIAEALVKLETEIKAEQDQILNEVTEARTIQEIVGLSQEIPEGFLEYGPPGFTEYGPPKIEPLPAKPAIAVENDTDAQSVESNETRRRRFSPKFKQSPRRKH